MKYNNYLVNYKVRQAPRAEIFYNVEDVETALEYFIAVAPEFEHLETFRYDLVDLTRQAMSDKAQQMLSELKDAYTSKNIKEFKALSQNYLAAIKDLDVVLSADSMFLASTWLNKARSRAHNEEQLKLYEFNARNLITQWGPKNTKLKDYAQRQYGGMMGDFNYKRWQIFFEDANAALESNRKLDWDATNAKISDWEDEWANSTNEYPTVTTKEYVGHIKRVYSRYLE